MGAVLALAVGALKVFCFNFQPELHGLVQSVIVLDPSWLMKVVLSMFYRINKRGSQKDAEQKKNGNYFFYDEGADDEDDDFDDI